MKAKNRPKGVLSMHDRLKAHMAASAEATKYATEGIALAKAGKMTKAKAAAKRAEAAHARMLELEETTSHVLRHPSER